MTDYHEEKMLDAVLTIRIPIWMRPRTKLIIFGKTMPCKFSGCVYIRIWKLRINKDR